MSTWSASARLCSHSTCVPTWKHLSRRTAVLWAETGLTTQRWAELLVNFHLIAGDELVGLVRHADDRLQLLKHGVGHTFFESGGGVRGDAVVATIGDADGDIEELLGEGVERSGAHDLLDAFPGALQYGRIVRDGLPEIIDPVGLARGHDVVVDSANFRARVGIFNQSKCRHAILPKRGSPSFEGQVIRETVARSGGLGQKIGEGIRRTAP